MTVPTPGKAHAFSNQYPSILIVLGIIAAALIPGISPLRAATDYIYGLQNTNFNSGAPPIMNLVQFAISDAATSPTLASSIVLGNLGSYIPGYGTRGSEYINGLAIDSDSNAAYFNYTYGGIDSETGLSTLTFSLYRAAFDFSTNTWDVGAVGGTYGSFTVNQGTGAPLSQTVTGGAWPVGDFENGSYYSRGQFTDYMFRLDLDPTGTEANSITLIPNFDGLPTTVYGGGDVIIDNGQLYTATLDGTSTEFTVFMRRDLDDMLAGTGSATVIDIDSIIPTATYQALQIAGLGDSPYIYGLTQSGGQVFVFTNPEGNTASELGIQYVGSINDFLNGSVIADLSRGLSSPIAVPEPGGAALLMTFGMIALLRRRRLVA